MVASAAYRYLDYVVVSCYVTVCGGGGSVNKVVFLYNHL